MILLEDVLAGAARLGARVEGDVFNRQFEGFAHDSRNVRGGEMFVAVHTERADGHDFIADACRRGAAGLLCERPPDQDVRRTLGVTCVVVDDSRGALGAWAAYILHRQSPRVIGVTGSVGKTCTTMAIATLLRELGGDPRAVFENENFNDLFGLPISLSRLSPAHRTAVLELASDRAGEIAALCEIASPHLAVVTNIAPAHLQHFGTLARLAAEYGSLAEAAVEGLILNYDDPLVAGMAGAGARAQQRPGRPGHAVTWFGVGEGAEVRATDVQAQPLELRFVLRWRGESADVRLLLPGGHNVYTALAAAAVALRQGFTLDDVAAALEMLEPPAGRLRPVGGIRGSLLLDDSYSASLPSTLAALDALAACPPPRLAVIGEISGLRLVPGTGRALSSAESGPGGLLPAELGGSGHGPARAYQQLGEAATRAAEYLVAMGDDAEPAARAAIAAGFPREHVAVTHTPEDAVARVRDWLPSAGLSDTPAPSVTIPAGSPDPPRVTSNRTTRQAPSPSATVLVKGSEAARLERVVERLLAAPQSDSALLVRQAPGAKQVVPLHQDRAAWMEVDLGAIAANLQRLCALAAPAEVLAVLKADAYGHGAVRVARAALQHGAAMLGTAVLSEAATLRAHGIMAPLLVLGYTPSWQARDVVRLDVAVALFSREMAHHLSQAVLALQRPPVAVHLKVDTGMHRLGLLPEEIVPFARQVAALPGLRIEGLFTHFATADAADLSYAREQLARFEQMLADWRAAGLPLPRYIHAANSAATLRLPEAHFNLVRTGNALFGLHPSATTRCPPDFRPALALKTQIAQVKDLSPGEPVSYGARWVTSRPSRIAVLPIGYADGFRRAPTNWGEVLIRGHRAPLAGTVCMDMCMVDVTDVPGARAGDEVVLIGEQAGQRITAEDVAARLGTVNYEVVSQILARIPREIVSR